MKSASSVIKNSTVIKNGSKINHHTSPSFNVDQQKEHFEAEPSLENINTNDLVKNVNGTHCDDLRMAMKNLQLGFSSTVTRENNPVSMFRTKEYGGNIDTHLFRGVNRQTWNQFKDSKFLSYSHERGFKSFATSGSVLRQRHSSGVRQVCGKWNKWRDSFEPLSFVEKPYPIHSRSPSRSSGYGSLTSQSSFPESVPRIVDYMGPGMPAHRWDYLGGVCAPESVSSTVDLAGHHISAHNLYLGSPYVYCVFPHALYPAPPIAPVAPMWSVPSYPHHVNGVSPSIGNTFSADTGGGYLLYCEIAAYIGALVFLVYTACCCEQQLLLGGR
ncbi:hypothetical protein PR048_029963 [Dryococelus australis]|uniref:Uncharacterized protein n=1 Tax=Dryococelus australis TaxID=614101 RepID=A0ABQ9G7N1_9NEOP|nr:hypothetical protein PR048_029963 [Dryococelus australis]